MAGNSENPEEMVLSHKLEPVLTCIIRIFQNFSNSAVAFLRVVRPIHSAHILEHTAFLQEHT